MPAIDTVPMTLNEVLQLYQKPSSAQIQPIGNSDKYTQRSNGSNNLEVALLSAKTIGEKARAQAIAEAGLGVGIKAGISWQINIMLNAVNNKSRDLDTIYDFGRFMIHDRVIPPVITEARDLYNQSGNFELRLSGAYYKIESQARFTSTAPNWRDYFNFAKPTLDIELLQKSITPKGEFEENIWRLSVQQGWNQGVDQATLIIKNSFDRLNRDITGMIRFHTFVNQGKITLPAIATENVAITKQGESMAIDETLLRIITLPQFNGKMASWSASVVASPSLHSSTKEASVRTIQKDLKQ